MRRIALLFVATSFLVVTIRPFAFCPERQQLKLEGRLQHEVVVTRKLIYVLVTDRQGKPVVDLQKDEFVLLDNGKEMKITEFENHTLSLPGEERRAVAPISSPAEKAPAPAAPLISRTFFFLFDLVFADAGGFRLGREAAIRFMGTSLEPGDQVAVLSFTGGRSLNLLHRPDGERAEAKRAIEAIGLESLRPVAPARPAETAAPPIMTSGNAGTSFPSQSGRADAEAGVGRIVAGNFIWALDSLAQALRYAPGRKVLVLYSNGLHPSYLGRGPFFQGNADLGSAYKKICRKLADANVSVFSVNTEENTYLVAQVPESQKGVSSLREITTETGGRFLGDIYAVPDHLNKIDTMTGAFYVLGYPITESWDGRYHKVKVRVTRPDCEVNAQLGYFNPKPYPQYSDLEKKVHLVDLALSEKPLSQQPLRFSMQALPWNAGSRWDIHFVAEIPVDSLEEIAGPRLEAVSLIFSELDELIDSQRIDLDLNRPEIQGKSVFLQSDLSAPPGQYKCRIVLRNLDTGQAAVAAASTALPKPDPGVLRLYPPLFLISGGPAVYLSGGKSSPLTRELLARNFPQAENLVPLIGGPLPSGSEVLAIVRCEVPIKALPGLSFEASIKNTTTGEITAMPCVKVAEGVERGIRFFLLRLSFPKILPGTFLFELAGLSQGATSRVVRRTEII